MLILYTTPPVLSPGVTHDATDWQVAEDPDFENVVLEDLGDTTNKLVKIFDDSDLDPEKTYYSRSRIVFNTGLSEWSEANIIKLKESKQIDIVSDIPTVVAVPEITINFDPAKAPATFFTINTSEMSCNSNAYHKATDYIIEDEYGNVVYNRINDEANLTSLFIGDLKLEEGKLYYIRVAHRASSGDVSALGKYPIFVPKVPIEVTSNTENVDVTQDLVIQLAPIDEFKQLDYTFYAVGLNVVDELTSGTSDTLSFVISKDYLTNPAQLYMVKIKVTYSNGDTSDDKYVFITGALPQEDTTEDTETETTETTTEG